MHNRTLTLLISAIGLAACGAPAPVDPPTAAPAAQTAPQFVGLWAVSQEMCADPAWRFRTEEISTKGEVHCAFTQVTPEGARYLVEAMCTAEAPPAPYTIELAVSDAPREMVVSGGPWAAPTRLVYCGPAPSE